MRGVPIPSPHCPVTNLGLDVVERRRADEREADEEDVGLGVRKRAQSVVILLSSSIPETQAHGLAIDHNTRRVVIESIAARVSVSGVTVVVFLSRIRVSDGFNAHCGNVFAGEGICCV